MLVMAGWLQPAPERRLQRAVLAMEGRRLQQSMLRRKQQQLFRRLLFLSMLVLYQMRPLRLLLRLLLPLQSGLVWYYKSNRVE
jgi:hypothetical protein